MLAVTSPTLVPATAVLCPFCGPLTEWSYTQPPLLRGVGHGAATVYRVRGCQCGKIRIVDETTTNPKRLG